MKQDRRKNISADENIALFLRLLNNSFRPFVGPYGPKLIHLVTKYLEG